MGTLSLSNLELIDWSSKVKLGDGTYPAVAANGTDVVATFVYYYGLTGDLYSSVAEIR